MPSLEILPHIFSSFEVFVAGRRIDAFMASDETEIKAMDKVMKPDFGSPRQVEMESNDVDVRVEDGVFSWTRTGHGEK